MLVNNNVRQAIKKHAIEGMEKMETKTDKLTRLDKDTGYTLDNKMLLDLYEMVYGEKYVNPMDIGDNEPF